MPQVSRAFLPPCASREPWLLTLCGTMDGFRGIYETALFRSLFPKQASAFQNEEGEAALTVLENVLPKF